MKATTTTVQKTRQLWGNPKVMLSANDLIIEGKYYPLAQTLGAFVEVVPVEKTADGKTVAASKKPLTFGAVMRGIGWAFFIIFVLIMALIFSGDYDTFGGGGSNTLHRLVLNSEYGRVTVLQHTNRGKLNKIAKEVNQKLLEQGRTPATNGFEMAAAAR